MSKIPIFLEQANQELYNASVAFAQASDCRSRNALYRKKLLHWIIGDAICSAWQPRLTIEVEVKCIPGQRVSWKCISTTPRLQYPLHSCISAYHLMSASSKHFSKVIRIGNFQEALGFEIGE